MGNVASENNPVKECLLQEVQMKQKNDLYDIFYTKRGVCEDDITKKLPLIWMRDKGDMLVISLMFYMRSNKEVKGIHGRGEKLLSYYVVLWLLQNHIDVFNNHYETFIKDIGCYNDCLNLAKLAKERLLCNKFIYALLKPMATALINDKKIIDNLSSCEVPNLSLASKWAPREGKSFDVFIPYLKYLCGITGKKTNMKWRKYIQSIAHAVPNITTIEHLLSTKQYNKINFNLIPKKAFKLYKNAFMNIPELHDRVIEYLKYNRTDETITHTHIKQTQDIINVYSETKNFKKRTLKYQ